MKIFVYLSLMSCTLALSGSQAWACGIFCESCTQVLPTPLSDCSASFPLLFSTTDTRLTLPMLYVSYVNQIAPLSLSGLWVDSRGNAGDPSNPVCRSMSEATETFKRGIDTANLTPADREAIQKAREELSAKCPEPDTLAAAPIQLVVSVPARPWVDYLSAVRSLAGAQYDLSIERFQILKVSKTVWVAETAQYLLGRAFLLKSQKDWGGPDSTESTGAKQPSKPDLERSRAEFGVYLKRYPTGIYAHSAVGLMRRVSFLEGDTSKYDELFGEALNGAVRAKRPLDEAKPLLTETDAHLASVIGSKQPLIVAAQTLILLRGGAEVSEANLNAVPKESWKNYPGLLEFLQASGRWGHRKFAELVTAVPRAGADLTSDWVGLGHRYLLARSFDALKKYGAGKEQWLRLMDLYRKKLGEQEPINFLTAPFALNRLADRDLPQAVKLGPPDLIQRVLSEGDLKQVAQDASISVEKRKQAEAVYLELLLIRARYAEFIRFYESALGKKDFEPVETAVRTLLKKSNDPQALLNAGFFLQAKALKPEKFNKCGSRAEFSTLATEYLGETRPEKGAQLESPYLMYKRALKQVQTQSGTSKGSDLEPKILFHLINCHGRSASAGGPDSCFWKLDEEKDKLVDRKSWFNRLKSEFAGSSWAKKQKFYW